MFRGSGRAFGGLLLLGAGVLLLLNMLGYIDVSIGELFAKFWPCFLILAGLSQLSHGYRHGGAVLGGLIVTSVGAYFLASNLNLIEFSMGDFIRFGVPFILIAAGLSVLFKPSRHRSHQDRNRDRRGRRNDHRDDHHAGYEPPAPPPPPLDQTFNEYNSSLDEVFEQAFPEEKLKRKQEEERQRFENYAGQNGRKGHHGYNGHHEHHGHNGHHSGSKEEKFNKSGFIGDVRLGDEYFELKPTNISHFIGDTVIDLTKAQIPYGETKITVSAFIGDVKVFVPVDADLGVSVSSSSLIGDMKVLKENHGGFMSNVSSRTPNYSETSKRIKLNVSVFVGDIRINTVG